MWLPSPRCRSSSSTSGTSGILARSPYMLRAGYTQWMVATPLAKWTAEQGGKRVVLAVADYAPAQMR